MSQLIEEPRLFENLCSILYLGIGFILVKRNRGKPGSDGVSIADFEANLDEELSQLQQELSNWTYQPSPVRRVEIPKPGGKGMRLLGIPTVRDRVVQATLKLLLEPIFDPHFSPNSYGFRPGRSQHQAVEAAQRIVNSGKPYVVDIDLSKFFDRIHRRCRDTFASLKKTCLKHKISFWHYLKDRLCGESNIPPLSDLIRAAATCG